MKYWTQSVGALRIFGKKKVSWKKVVRTYFHVSVQAICLARMFQVLVLVSPSVVFSAMESVADVPNSTYTAGMGEREINEQA